MPKSERARESNEKQGEKVGSLRLWSVEGEWQRFKGSCFVVILMLLGGMIQRPHISSGTPLICWMSLRQLNPAKYWLRPSLSIKSLSKRAGEGDASALWHSLARSKLHLHCSFVPDSKPKAYLQLSQIASRSLIGVFVKHGCKRELFSLSEPLKNEKLAVGRS